MARTTERDGSRPRALVVHAHPSTESFNHHLAETTAEALATSHATDVIDPDHVSDVSEERNLVAQRALREADFNPARKDGRAVRSEVVIELAAGSDRD